MPAPRHLLFTKSTEISITVKRERPYQDHPDQVVPEILWYVYPQLESKLEYPDKLWFSP